LFILVKVLPIMITITIRTASKGLFIATSLLLHREMNKPFWMA
jgi:hypothetical protein